MLILPVLDLKGGLVVRGVAGLRSEYQPVQSVIAADAQPATVARAYAQEFGLREVYVADLDAIAGAEPDWTSYRAIAGAGLRLWIDAGTRSQDRASEIADFDPQGQPPVRVIAGLESLDRPAVLADIVQAVGAAVVFSLDLKQGRPLLSPQATGWSLDSPLEIAATAWDCGVRSMILLDLARVGVSRGAGTEDLCRQMVTRWPSLELVGGGGMRSLADVQALRSAGCQRVLVASALHDGRISAQDVARAC